MGRAFAVRKAKGPSSQLGLQSVAAEGEDDSFCARHTLARMKRITPTAAKKPAVPSIPKSSAMST